MLLLQPNPALWEERSLFVSPRDGDWLPRYRSVAQSAAAVPAYLLSTEVLGVKPTRPGFAEFAVHSSRGGLAWAEGVMPSPAGDIAVRWQSADDRFELAVTVPPGTRATVHLPAGKACGLNGRP